MNTFDTKKKALITAQFVLCMDDDQIQNTKRKWSKQWLLQKKKKYSHIN